MFTSTSLDDHPQTILINRRRMMLLGIVSSEQVADAADAYRKYLKEKYGLSISRAQTIRRCDSLPR